MDLRRLVPNVRGAILSAGLWAGCGAATEPPAPTEPAEAVESAPDESVERHDGLTIHEWGLIDTRAARPRAPASLSAIPGQAPSAETLRDEARGDEPGDEARGDEPGEEASGSSSSADSPTSRPRPPTSRPRAPLLYFHLPPDHEPLEIEVHVALERGLVEETWPLAQPDEERIPDDTNPPSRVRWDATIRPEACTGSSYPSPDEPPCDDPLRFYCEASRLRFFEASDAACVSVDGHDFNHLFYRGTVRTELPLSATKDASGSVQVTLARPIVGPIYRIQRRDGRVLVRTASPPEPGTPLTLEMPNDPADSARNLLLRTLATEFELTGPEVRAFHTAWDDALFQVQEERDHRVRRDGYLPPRDSLLYILREEDVTRIAPIRFDPAPETFRRAIVVQVDLDPEPRSYLHAGQNDSPRPE